MTIGIRILVFMTLLQLTNSRPRDLSSGTLEGTVVRAASGKPLENIHVDLIQMSLPDSSDIAQRSVNPSAITDVFGRFQLTDVKPGQYRLVFAGNGFVRQEYNQRTFPGTGTPINVGSGQVIRDLLVALTPTGSVSGNIRDRANRPLAGVPVQLMRDGFDSIGERRVQPNGMLVKTDDRGDFRIFHVTPGRYYLNAGTPQGYGSVQAVEANEVPGTFANTYFPGVLSFKDAAPIEVQAGSEKTGMNFIVQRIRGVRVSGQVLDSVTGTAPENVQVKLSYRDPGTGSDHELQYLRGGFYKEGKFEFRDVLPGLFAVVVTMDLPGQALNSDRPRLQRLGYVPVEVGNTDIDGIVVSISSGSSIAGKVRAEGQSSLFGTFLDPSAKPSVSLIQRQNGIRPATPGMPNPQFAPFNMDNGSFRIENVMPGEYGVYVNWLPPSFYLKEAHLGSADVLNTPFRFTGRETGDLEIVVSPNVASVNGTITNSRMTPAAGAQVVLIPDKSRHRPELYKTTSTDVAGHFNLINISPGDYKLYAWETIEQYRWFDRDYVKEDERFAQTVHLGESERQVVDARLIPAR